MSPTRYISLPHLRVGQSGTVKEITGGSGVVKKLTALGLRPGQIVTKRDSVFTRGPVVLKVNNTQMAIGYGMAQKVLVEVEEE
ncbi:MAG: ferrous iron transport protein A [Gemmatimonadota bacterium]|nr:MAG: ferrous iron transport protein A [Gemmatimonadota bacterium]